jgi:4-hydroxybenzoyl-CoA reductase subunit beta
MLRLPTCEATFPASIAEAIELKAKYGTEASYVAGGTDLYPNMKRRQQTPYHLIDIRRIPELGSLEVDGDGSLIIGAGVTLTRLIRDARVAADWPVLGQAAATISTPVLQNMGTVGGNLLLDTRCNYYDQSYEWRKAIDFCMKKDGEICWVAPSSPRCWAVQSSDLVPVMVALGAEVTLAGPDGTRTIPAQALYHNDGIEFLTKQPDELLVSVQVLAMGSARATYQKLRRRGSFDFPVLGVAAWIKPNGGATVAEARVVLGAVGSYPIVSEAAAEALVGNVLEDDTIDVAARAAAKPAKPLDNTDFTIGWRKDMVAVYVRRALEALK